MRRRFQTKKKRRETEVARKPELEEKDASATKVVNEEEGDEKSPKKRSCEKARTKVVYEKDG